MPIPTTAAPLTRARASEVVLESLRGWIVSGVLAPGETLRDSELAAAFGISRTPVREALLRLEREGLVESSPGRWTRVTPVDPTALTRLMPLWVELAALGARLAAGSPESAAQAGALERAHAAWLAAPDPRAAAAADIAFHLQVLDTAANDYLTSAVRPVAAALARIAACADGQPLGGRCTPEGHAAILAALRAGDGRAAADATRAGLQHDTTPPA